VLKFHVVGQLNQTNQTLFCPVYSFRSQIQEVIIFSLYRHISWTHDLVKQILI
jgi:hypothetical protein